MLSIYQLLMEMHVGFVQITDRVWRGITFPTFFPLPSLYLLPFSRNTFARPSFFAVNKNLLHYSTHNTAQQAYSQTATLSTDLYKESVLIGTLLYSYPSKIYQETHNLTIHTREYILLYSSKKLLDFILVQTLLPPVIPCTVQYTSNEHNKKEQMFTIVWHLLFMPVESLFLLVTAKLMSTANKEKG